MPILVTEGALLGARLWLALAGTTLRSCCPVLLARLIGSAATSARSQRAGQGRRLLPLLLHGRGEGTEGIHQPVDEGRRLGYPILEVICEPPARRQGRDKRRVRMQDYL